MNNKDKIEQAIINGTKFLISECQQNKFWNIGIEGGARPLAHLIIMLNLISEKNEYRDIIEKLIFRLKNLQSANGGWNLYEGGYDHLPTTIESYLSLRLARIDCQDPSIERAKKHIIANGSLKSLHGPTRIILAILNQVNWSTVILPPIQWLLIPNERKFSINSIDKIVTLHLIPAMILKALNYTLSDYSLNLQDELGTDENLIIYPKLFNIINLFDKHKKEALERGFSELRIYQGEDGTIGGILTSTELTYLAAKAMNLSNDDPLIQGTKKAIVDFAYKALSPNKDRVRTINSWVRDSIYSTYTLIEVNKNNILKQDPKLLSTTNTIINNALSWLKKKRILLSPGCGWGFYDPESSMADVDDTSIMAKIILSQEPISEEWNEILKEILDWFISMQQNDGGFALIGDRMQWEMNKITPTAGFSHGLFNITDVSSIDATSRVIDVLGSFRMPIIINSIKKAINYIAKNQNSEGNWLGRLKLGFIYGTSIAITSLNSAHIKDLQICKELSIKGCSWLEMIQNKDGGWGENCDSIKYNKYIPLNRSNAWHTAMALKGLISFYGHKSLNISSINKGIEYLISLQDPEGYWREDEPTGIAIPHQIYLYHPGETLNTAITTLCSYYNLL